jgi:hypothetical protein
MLDSQSPFHFLDLIQSNAILVTLATRFRDSESTHAPPWDNHIALNVVISLPDPLKSVLLVSQISRSSSPQLCSTRPAQSLLT